MSFRGRVITSVICAVAVVSLLTASLVAIFANNNLLVKTNISVSYTAPDLTEAYVTTNVWKSGETEKTPVLATTNVANVAEASSVTETLTEKNNYMVFEFAMENRSAQDLYYFQTTFTNTSVSNMKLEYCVVSQTPLEPEEILSQDLGKVEEYYWKGGTRLCNNIEVQAGQTVYAYAVATVADILFNASFTGNFDCNISLDPFDERQQLNIVYESGGYYVYMGEMPQSYAGTDGTAFTLQQETYTECGVEYEVYKDAVGNKYAKKDGAYYKFEKIRWRVKGLFSGASLGGKYPNANYIDTQYKNKYSKYLFIISDKILFNSAWNSTLTRANYPNSTIYANLTEFYNNILAGYESIIDSYTTSYNLVETKTFTTLEDSSTIGTTSTVVQKLFIPNTTLVRDTYFMTSTASNRKAYYTSWAVGTESTTTYGKWWTRTNQYDNTDGEIFVANAVGTDGNFVATNINEVCGVRPVMVITLP